MYVGGCWGGVGGGRWSHDHHSHTRSVLLMVVLLFDIVESSDEDSVCVSGMCVCWGWGGAMNDTPARGQCCRWGLSCLTLWCLYY